MLGGSRYRISLVGKENVCLEREGTLTQIPLHLMEKFHLDGALTIHPIPKKGMELATRLNALPPQAIRAAVERAEWVDMAKLDPKSVPRSERTIQRYRKAMRNAGEVLIPANPIRAGTLSLCRIDSTRMFGLYWDRKTDHATGPSKCLG